MTNTHRRNKHLPRSGSFMERTSPGVGDPDQRSAAVVRGVTYHYSNLVTLLETAKQGLEAFAAKKDRKAVYECRSPFFN